MKTVKLTQEEIDVILSSLQEKDICRIHCYCGYVKKGMCEKKKSDGTYVCRLKQNIESIRNKLG